MARPLLNRGFLSLVVTQFFGAANDNVLKQVLTFMVVSGIWTGELGSGGQGVIGLAFTLPFIILSGIAGQIADRHSKRSVMLVLKVFEIPIAAIGMVGFWTDNLWITFSSLVLLTCQSAFFGPVKYGMIPELVDDEDLSRANGMINMLTNVAVIAGALAAGWISDLYYPVVANGTEAAQAVADSVAGIAPEVDRVAWAPGLAMVLLASLGLVAATFMTPLVPGDRSLKQSANPFSTYFEVLREMSATPLLKVTLAWGYFYFLGSLVLLIVPEYTIVLKITNEKVAHFLGAMGIGIAVGSVTAGFVSGDRIRLGLVPIGGAGLFLFFLLLGLLPPTYVQVLIMIAASGFFAGFYIIPLQSMLQHLSPADERGRFLGTANAVSFGFIALASGIYWLIRRWFPDDQPQRIFLVSAALMGIGLIFVFLKLRHAHDAAYDDADPVTPEETTADDQS